ncbi:hypothetical protein GOODEAATRI_005765 [Goodea atripinnis]|uniref:Uncharacterized protein n=1 Tax=Goodea atripinnis TaxID=208336 RepID=A0ABV0PBM4_9TELE
MDLSYAPPLPEQHPIRMQISQLSHGTPPPLRNHDSQAKRLQRLKAVLPTANFTSVLNCKMSVDARMACALASRKSRFPLW